MATVTKIVNKINALIQKINNKTKYEDTTLIPAVEHLLEMSGGEDIQSLLPDGYTAMKYIESSGTQYINTDYIPQENTKVICTGCWTYAGSDKAPNLFGVGRPVFYLNAKQDLSSINACYGSMSQKAGHSGPKVPLTYVMDKNGLVIKGADDYNSVAFTDTRYLSGTNKLLMFAFWNINGYPEHYSLARIYRMKIFDGELLTHDYIPCMRETDEVLGYYDVIANVFKTNAGSGEFSAEEL